MNMNMNYALEYESIICIACTGWWDRGAWCWSYGLPLCACSVPCTYGPCWRWTCAWPWDRRDDCTRRRLSFCCSGSHGGSRPPPRIKVRKAPPKRTFLKRPSVSFESARRSPCSPLSSSKATYMYSKSGKRISQHTTLFIYSSKTRLYFLFEIYNIFCYDQINILFVSYNILQYQGYYNSRKILVWL